VPAHYASVVGRCKQGTIKTGKLPHGNVLQHFSTKQVIMLRGASRAVQHAHQTSSKTVLEQMKIRSYEHAISIDTATEAFGVLWLGFSTMVGSAV
jgi:hypothetical protein